MEVKKQKVTLRVTNSKLQNKKIHFELLTRWLNFHFFQSRVMNVKLRNIKLHLKLLTGKLEKRFFILYALYFVLYFTEI